MCDSIATVLAAVSFLTASTALAGQPEPTPPAAPAPAASAPVAAAQPASPPPTVTPEPPPTTLVGSAAASNPSTNLIKSKWAITLSGFFQLDSIYDTTESFTDAAAGTAIARPGTFQANNDRMNFSIRNSRIGLRLAAPEFSGVRTSAFLEFDFLGNLTPPLTETQLFSNPSVRARHIYLKVENDYVNVLVGQTWHIFGWQPFYFPNTTALQGMPGETFGRSMQVQLSRSFPSPLVNVDVAVAGVRPPERDSAMPDLQGGLRFLFNKWRALHVNGNGGYQAVDPSSIGVSGLVRRFSVREFSAAPMNNMTATGWGISIDGLTALIPATNEHRQNALILQGSFQTGSGFNDQ